MKPMMSMLEDEENGLPAMPAAPGAPLPGPGSEPDPYGLQGLGLYGDGDSKPLAMPPMPTQTGQTPAPMPTSPVPAGPAVGAEVPPMMGGEMPMGGGMMGMGMGGEMMPPGPPAGELTDEDLIAAITQSMKGGRRF